MVGAQANAAWEFLACASGIFELVSGVTFSGSATAVVKVLSDGWLTCVVSFREVPCLSTDVPAHAAANRVTAPSLKAWEYCVNSRLIGRTDFLQALCLWRASSLRQVYNERLSSAAAHCRVDLVERIVLVMR